MTIYMYLEIISLRSLKSLKNLELQIASSIVAADYFRPLDGKIL